MRHQPRFFLSPDDSDGSSSSSTNNGKERVFSRVTCHSWQINARVSTSGLRELASLVAVGLVGSTESPMDLSSPTREVNLAPTISTGAS